MRKSIANALEPTPKASSAGERIVRTADSERAAARSWREVSVFTRGGRQGWSARSAYNQTARDEGDGGLNMVSFATVSCQVVCFWQLGF